MRKIFAVLACLTIMLGTIAAPAQRSAGSKPTESIWVPAPTPPGGTSWAVLESTKEIQRQQSGTIYSKPDFSPRVKALNGKRIRVNGYVMPLQNAARQSHFVLLAYPPDCPFHLDPAPTQFLEVRVVKAIAVNSNVRTIEGVLTLAGADESGIFYKLTNATEV